MRQYLPSFFRHNNAPPTAELINSAPIESIAPINEAAAGDLGNGALVGTEVALVDNFADTAPEVPETQDVVVAGVAQESDGLEQPIDAPEPQMLLSKHTAVAEQPAQPEQDLDDQSAQILLAVEEDAALRPDTGEGLLEDLIRNPQKYPPVIRPHVMRVAMRHGGTDAALDNLHELHDLQAVTLDTATEFIEQGYAYYVASNIDLFPNGTPVFADKLIAQGQGGFVLNHPEKFPGVELNVALVDKFIGAGSAGVVIDKVIANEIPGVSMDTNMVEKLIETQNGDTLVKLIQEHKVEGYSLDSGLAGHLLEHGNASAVAHNIEQFGGLDRDAAVKMIQQGYGQIVIRKPEQFSVHRDAELFLNFVTYGNVKGIMGQRETFGMTGIGCMNEEIAAQIAIREPQLAGANLHLFSSLDRATRNHLERELGYPVEVFPADGTRREQDTWFANNADTYLAGPWPQAKLGQFIRRRIEQGIEPDMHDGSVWLSEFAVPDQAPDIEYIKTHRLDVDFDAAHVPELTMHDSAAELELIRSICSASADLRARLNLSAKPEMVTQLFSTPEHQLLYATLVTEHEGTPLFKRQDLDAGLLTELAHGKLPDFWREHNGSVGRNAQANFRATQGDFESMFATLIKSGAITEAPNGERKITELIGDLKSYGQNRKRYTDDATEWLMKHATSPHVRLTKVWLDRPAALINGVELDENGRRVATVDDNARSVEQWQAHNALEELVVGMEASGELAKSGFTAQELLSRKWKDARTELVRVLSVQNMVTAMSVMKSAQEKRNWDEKVLPASSVQVMPEQEEGGSDWSEAPASVRSWTYEVLDKDDPRGFTIGPDTGCCMTVRGKARSCITAGYELKNAGFVALYDPDGRLAAQSFWFVHPDSPDKLVMDNIEAVKGRNMHKILGLYRQGIEAVLKNASEHSDASLIRYAQVGEGCTKVDLGDLDRVDSVPKLDDAIYSDARHQRLLLDMHAR